MNKKLLTALTILLVAISLILLTNYFIPISSGISPSGSVSSNLPIEQNKNYYTFTADNIYEIITIKKSNIIIDGKNFTSGPIKLDYVTNVTIKNLNMKSGRWTINLDHSSNNKIININSYNCPITLFHSHNNVVSQNLNLAIWITESNNNTIQNSTINRMELRKSTNNAIINNEDNKQSWFVWLELTDSKSNLIYKNTISNSTERWISYFGESTENIFVANQVTGPFDTECYFASENNQFYSNNFIDAFQFINEARDKNNQPNQWDNGKTGNYYNNYNGQDTNNDGIGDTPHVINEYNKDNYPIINPINIESEIKPQLPPIQNPTNQTAQTIILTIILTIAIILSIGYYKRKTLNPILNRIDKKTYILAAIFSVLSGIILIISTFYGYGTYLTYSWRGDGMGTSGNLHRLLLFLLPLLGASLIISGFGHRKLLKQNHKKTANLILTLSFITTAILLYIAYLVSTAQPIYLQGNVGPYWNRCFFEDIDKNIAFSQLTILSLISLGLTQITQTKTIQNSTYQEKHPKLNKTFTTTQTLSGITLILLPLTSTMFPFYILLIIGILPLSILFLTTQTINATTLLKKHKENFDNIPHSHY